MSLRIAPVFFLSVGFTVMAREPSGTAILRRAAEAYKSLKSESVEATVVTEMKTFRTETPIAGWIARPGKLRFEVTNSMIGSQTISDGRSTWKYVPSFGQYTRTPAFPNIFPVPEGSADILIGAHIMDRLHSAKLLRREKLTVDGKPVDCDVIEAAYTPERPNPGPPRTKTFWVDIRRKLILKASSLVRMDSSEAAGPLEMAQSISVNSIKLNTRMPDSLFVFIPPEGAREVSELTPPGGKPQAPPKVDIDRE